MIGRRTSVTREELILTALLVVASAIFAILPSARQPAPGDVGAPAATAVAAGESGATAPYAVRSNPLRPNGELTEATLPNHSSRR